MNKRRLGAILLLLAMVFWVFAGTNRQVSKLAQAEENGLTGSCGEEVYWQLIPEEDGYELYISGRGKIQNFATPEAVPWYEYREQIHTLTLEEGITGIGSRSFFECAFRGELTLPETLTYIGHYAFYGCEGFQGGLVIPSAVKWIGAYAFYRNGFEGSLQLPEGLQRIEVKAFANCSFTGTLTVPNSVKKIGARAFYACKNLEGALVIPKGVSYIGISAFNGCTGIKEVYLYSDAEIGRDAFEVAYQGTIYNLSETVEDEDLVLDQRQELGVVYSVYGMVNGTERLLGKVSASKEGEEPVQFAPEEIKEDGFLFGGWYADEACTTPWEASTALTGDITLYAKMEKVEVTPVPTKAPEGDEGATDEPEVTPTVQPTKTPEVTPTDEPELTPTKAPELTPTVAPEVTTTVKPELTGAITPPATPTRPPEVTPIPTSTPGTIPVMPPTAEPTAIPTVMITPTTVPEVSPTGEPGAPVPIPTKMPTVTPTPTVVPVATATATPTEEPSATATETPTEAPSATATETPTEMPSATASATPTEEPSVTATETPTETPTESPGEENEPTENATGKYGTAGLLLIYVAAGSVLVAVLVLTKKIKKSEL